MSWLINSAQLEKFRKNQKNLIILDASLHMHTDQRNAKQEFVEKHIIESQFFDIDAFNDPQVDLPHQLIHDEKIISEKLGKLGIRNDYKIIIYDNSDLHSACRAVWMFKVFGHNPNLLYVLDGGLKAWEKFGGKTESGEPFFSARNYSAEFKPQFLCSLDAMKEAVKNPTEQIIDLRHPVRFAGGPEKRPNVRSGHIPKSICFPYFIFFDKEGFFLPLEKLRKKLTDLTVDLTVPIISTCGSGITAPILDFVLDLMEHAKHTVYDGSWSEWGAEKLYPNETSLEERPVETCVDK